VYRGDLRRGGSISRKDAKSFIGFASFDKIYKGWVMPKELPVAEDYEEFLGELKERIKQAQVRAVLAVNRELILLYWQIGRDILWRQQQQGWGAKVIDRLAADLRKAFPEIKGFSSRNLKYMRAFAEAYPNEQFVQQSVARIPWGHNVRILDGVKTATERE